jgi:thiosulfate dehydrogenase
MITIAQQWLTADQLSEPYRWQRTKSLSASLSALALGVSVAWAPVGAQEARPPLVDQGQAATLSYGGRLYDNHWVVLKLLPPSEPNPTYPADPHDAPKTTWRCVSCHGWDYSGSNGHLGQIGPKFVSIAGAKDRDPDQIARFLRSGSHSVIVAPVPDEALHALSLFICCGQHDIRSLIGPNGEAKGDPLRGKDIYDGVCNRCHQADGKAPIYGEPGDASSLGWVARQRPAQAAHKIRNGVPSADMVSLRFLDIERIGDLLAYLQTLDAE